MEGRGQCAPSHRASAFAAPCRGTGRHTGGCRAMPRPRLRASRQQTSPSTTAARLCAMPIAVIVPCDHPFGMEAPADPPWPGLLANRLKLRVRLRVIPKHLAAMDAAVMVSSHHRSANGTRSPVPSMRGFFTAVHHVWGGLLAANHGPGFTSWSDACRSPTLAGVAGASNDVPAAKVAPSISPQPPISPPGGHALG